jgi:YspA, cpYpsA-related SLOG family
MGGPVRILITGSREWTDWRLLHWALKDAARGVRWDEVTVVHGDCPSGADFFAGDFARCAGMTEERHPADWDKHGKAAGPIRNQEMVNAGADVCLAFFQPGAANRGTRDCASRAERAGIPVRRYPDPEGADGEPSGGSPDSPAAGKPGVPGGSDDYLPVAPAGDDPGIDWPVLPGGVIYRDAGGWKAWMEPDGTWHAEIIPPPPENGEA